MKQYDGATTLGKISSESSDVAFGSNEPRAVLHQPVIGQATVTHGVGNIGVPQELSHNTRLPSNSSVVPMIHQRDPFIEDFNVRAPDVYISFGQSVARHGFYPIAWKRRVKESHRIRCIKFFRRSLQITMDREIWSIHRWGTGERTRPIGNRAAGGGPQFGYVTPLPPMRFCSVLLVSLRWAIPSATLSK
jgi:hypothetical protein